MSCTPKIELSLCNDNCHIADSESNATLLIYKQGVKQCTQVIEPNEIGQIILTKDNIADFGDLYHTFRLVLKDETNDTIPFIYLDCNGIEQEAEEIRLSFNECEFQSIKLVQEC